MTTPTDHISGAASDALALILIANQFDPLFEKSIKDILMKAKLKYPPLSELLVESVKEVNMWQEIRDIENECMNDGSIGSMDRYRIMNERTHFLREDYKDQQTKTNRLRREIADLVREDTRTEDDQ